MSVKNVRDCPERGTIVPKPGGATTYALPSPLVRGLCPRKPDLSEATNTKCPLFTRVSALNPPDELLRQAFPVVLVGTRSMARRLHIPKEATEHLQPLCNSVSEGAWKRKEVAVYPPGYAEWCSRCVEKLHLQDDWA